MLPSSPISARSASERSRKMQPGTVVSYTVVRHPPAGFGVSARTIGLIALDDATQVLAPLLSAEPRIGMRVAPRMRLTAVTPEKLRLYDVAYEEAVPVTTELERAFPGYLVALTGPSGVGKTAVAAVLLKTLSGYASRVPLVTTAKRAEGEHGELKHVSTRVFEEAVQSGDIVAMAHEEIDGAKAWYGYRASDIDAIRAAGKLPVVTGGVPLLRGLSKHYGRRAILSFGLLPPGRSKRAMLSYLLRQLRTRGRSTEQWIEEQIRRAATDLHALAAHAELFDRVLVNDDASAVAELLRQQVPTAKAS